MSHVFLIDPDAGRIVRSYHFTDTPAVDTPAKWAEIHAEARQEGYRVALCTEQLANLGVLGTHYPVDHQLVFTESIRVTEAGALTFEQFDPVLNSRDVAMYAPGKWTYCATGGVPLTDQGGCRA